MCSGLQPWLASPKTIAKPDNQHEAAGLLRSFHGWSDTRHEPTLALTTGSSGPLRLSLRWRPPLDLLRVGAAQDAATAVDLLSIPAEVDSCHVKPLSGSLAPLLALASSVCPRRLPLPSMGL